MLDLEMLSDQSQLHFDEYVVNGSDDELFASGYLRGHVDLVIGGALAQQESLELNEVVERITASVNTAIRNGELEQNDIQVVNRILNTLIESWR
jgi:hypothetical protein